MRAGRLAFVAAFVGLLVLEALLPCRPVVAPATSAHDCCAPAAGLRAPAPNCCPDGSRAQDRIGTLGAVASAMHVPTAAIAVVPVAAPVAAPLATAPPFAGSPPLVLRV